MKNPFKAMAEMYKSQVKQYDKLGYAKTFKHCTELFFEDMNKQLSNHSTPVHFTDIKYLDGYFIFGFGTNSVIHFKVNECPGWQFGIWWDVPDEEENEEETTKERDDVIKGKFFAQYEETLGKFKPTRSNHCTDISVYLNESPQICNVWFEPMAMIEFIRDYPYLAFCRDYWGWDYNFEYHSEEEAKEEFEKYKERKAHVEKYEKLFDDKILNFVKEKIIPALGTNEVILYDGGENVSPRYDLIAPYSKNKHLVSQPGCYDWFEKDNEDGQKLLKEFYDLRESLKEDGNSVDVYWYCPIDPVITFTKKKIKNSI